jgi:ADP-ribosylglycohydrolase
VTTKVTAQQLSKARGCVLGLVLGDALGAVRAQVPRVGTLHCTCAGQLACFTVEGTIRGSVRYAHKGICNPVAIVWRAYTRWAAMQGIPGVGRSGDGAQPDGWQSEVPVLATRRGSAPATVTALQETVMGTLTEPVGTSTGAHALTRALPIGLIQPWFKEPVRFAADTAALSHAGEAASAAAIGVGIVSAAASGLDVDEAADRALERLPDHVPGERVASRVLEARAAAESVPRRAPLLERLAPDARAMSALAGAVYVASSFPGPRQVRGALQFAAATRNGTHVAAAAGAFLGAAHPRSTRGYPVVPGRRRRFPRPEPIPLTTAAIEAGSAEVEAARLLARAGRSQPGDELRQDDLRDHRGRVDQRVPDRDAGVEPGPFVGHRQHRRLGLRARENARQ